REHPMIRTRLQIALVCFTLCVSPLALAGDTPDVAWEHPRWVNPMEPFAGTLTLSPGMEATEIRVTAEYLGDDENTVVATAAEGDSSIYAFSFPAIEPYGGAGGGEYVFYAQIQTPE